MSNKNFEDTLKVKGVMAQGYGVIPKMVMRDKRLAPEAKTIYAYLCSFAGSGSTAFPGVDLMMEELNMSRARFYKHRQSLVDCGYLCITPQREGNKRANNVYELVAFPEIIIQQSEIEQSRFVTVENVTVQNETVQNVTAINNSSINNNLNNNNLKKKERKDAVAAPLPARTSSFDSIINERITDERLKESLGEFIKMRKLIKSPLTDRALSNIIAELNRLAPGNADTQIQIVEQSITNAWKGVFALKGEYNNAGYGGNGTSTRGSDSAGGGTFGERKLGITI